MNSTSPMQARPSDQCEFGSWNDTTKCWNMRSCSDCLQQQGCMIGDNGICQSNVNTNARYRDAFYQNLTLPAAKDRDESALRVKQKWEFPAFEVTYCSSDDEICNECIREKFWVPPGGQLADSRFCLGRYDCVCIMNCEFNHAKSICVDEKTVVTEPPAPVGSLPTADECRYKYKSSSTCYTYRSCSECADMAGCRIGTDGYCEPDASRSSEYDYHQAITNNVTLPLGRDLNATGLLAPQHWQFPASEVTYCPKESLTCQECERAKFWLDGTAAPDSRFCVGVNDCICVANCPSEDSLTYCPSSNNNNNSHNDDSENMDGLVVYGIIALVGLILGAVAICGCIFAGCRRVARPRSRSDAHVEILTPLPDGVPLAQRA